MEKEKVKFEFDPYKSENATIRGVFQDDLAQIIWCVIKRNHLVDQYFNENCLRIATELRRKKWGNITERQLNGMLKDCHMIGSQEEGVGLKLLPYIKKEIILEYIINST